MDSRYMEIAIEEALEGAAKGAGGPFGAVLVKGYRIIATSHDMVVKTNDPTAHAEMNVIRIASKLLERHDLNDCVLYCSTEPCPMCLAAAIQAGITEIYYACSIQDAKEIGFDDQRIYDYIKHPKENSQLIKLKSFLREDGLVVFKNWKEQEGRITY